MRVIVTITKFVDAYSRFTPHSHMLLFRKEAAVYTLKTNFKTLENYQFYQSGGGEL